MAEEVRLPKLSASMKEGIIVEWLAKEGQHVVKGKPLYQVETDKAVMEVESPVDGVLRRIMVGRGKTVAVGAALALIE